MISTDGHVAVAVADYVADDDNGGVNDYATDHDHVNDDVYVTVRYWLQVPFVAVIGVHT